MRARGDLVEMRVAATNQLSALLDAHWPGAKAIFADVESPVSLEFLTRYPTPAAAAHLGEKRMTAFCVKHGYCGRRTAAQLLERLRDAPAGATGEALTEETPRRRARRGRRAHRAERLGEEPRPLCRRPPRGTPGRRDLHVAAKVGSGQRRPGARRVGRCPPSLRAPRLRRRPGRGHPVTTQSGKHRGVHFRWASDKRFRTAITTFADNSRHASPWAAKISTTPAPAAKTTPTPCASSPAPGSASSGAAGSTASPTTPPNTEPQPRS